jgi:predicted GNAT family N-acyltransferase
MRTSIRIIEFGSPEHDEEVALRTKVLRKPLGLSFSKEDLQSETNQIHIGAFVDSTLVGCLLLISLSDTVVKMRQVAVDPDQQKSGLGKQLVEFCEALAQARGFKEIELNARQPVVGFYEKLGYHTVGEAFIEVGIPHRKMKKNISLSKGAV